jgi:hypothetical protein
MINPAISLRSTRPAQTKERKEKEEGERQIREMNLVGTSLAIALCLGWVPVAG